MTRKVFSSDIIDVMAPGPEVMVLKDKNLMVNLGRIV